MPSRAPDNSTPGISVTAPTTPRWFSRPCGGNERRVPHLLAGLEIEREMPAADQTEVGLLAVNGAAEERLAATARDFARHILLPDHLAVVRIECPDEALFLRRDEDVAAVGGCRERRGRRKIPVGPEQRGAVFRRIRNGGAAGAAATSAAPRERETLLRECSAHTRYARYRTGAPASTRALCPCRCSSPSPRWLSLVCPRRRCRL